MLLARKFCLLNIGLQRSNYSLYAMVKPRMNFADDIVDDSEPERMERRLIRDPRQRTNPENRMGGKRYEKILDVIELTDNELDDVPRATRPNTIGTSFTLTSSESDRAMENATSTSLCSQVEIATLLNMASASPAEGHQSLSLRTLERKQRVECEHDDKTGPTKLDLRRFAHRGTTTSSSARPQVSLSSSIPLQVPPSFTKQRSRGKAYQLAPDFSDAYLARMTRCVCCDIPWQTTKTAAIKMRHVLSCAKQHGIDSNTLESAIRNEIERLSVGISKGGGPQKVLIPSNEGPHAENTLFEDLVTSTVSKKKGRFHATTSSVASASITRKATLDRARVILEQRGSALVDPHLDHNTDMLSTLHDGDELLPGTQKFAPSKLGTTRRLMQQFPSTPGHLDNSDAIPESSHSIPCRNAPTRVIKERRLQVGLAIENPCEKAPPRTGSKLAIPPTPPPQIARPVKIIPFSPDMKPLDEFCGIDEISLHGDLSIHPYNPLPVSLEQIEPATLRANPARLKVSRAPRGRKMLPDLRDAFDEQKMKSRIMCDRQLHLRILRYEPIHFDVFLKLAIPDVNARSGKIKLQLRAFLDRQAINFYGADRTGRT